MKSSIIRIGNSKAVRIPKALLEESGLANDVNLRLSDGKIIIELLSHSVNDRLLLSRSSLAKDWNTTEEDEAWSYLQ